jgi:CheY-like chemotaxis protein
MMPGETIQTIKVAVVDYDMPEMNGCALADRLRSICPDILHYGVSDVPQREMSNPFSNGT